MARRVCFAGEWTEHFADVKAQDGQLHSRLSVTQIFKDELHEIFYLRIQHARKRVRSIAWPRSQELNAAERLVVKVLKGLKRDKFSLLMLECNGLSVCEIAKKLRMNKVKCRKMRDRLLFELRSMISG